jgi:hypothetical protein
MTTGKEDFSTGLGTFKRASSNELVAGSFTLSVELLSHDNPDVPSSPCRHPAVHFCGSRADVRASKSFRRSASVMIARMVC